MWLVHTALRRPITVLIAVIAVGLCAILAILRMRTDIFPNLNLPVIYVAQPYGGMSPAQMEGYIVFYYEYHFLYINGIESVEDKSIQGNGLLKLTFHPGTDMSQALAQTISYVNRAHAFMPYGTIPPFVIRFDAGTVPVGYLVFSSKTRSVGQIQDLALNRVRPVFATLPGVSSPPPFGGNQRTIVITIDPERLRAYHLSPDAVVQAINSGNILQPAGNVRTRSLLRLVASNAVAVDIQSLLDVPIRNGAGPAVYLHDIGTVADSSDIPTGYALVNGRRAVYIPVTKRPDASTLAVVNEVKRNLPRFRSLIPPDIEISYEFDQSGYVRDSLISVIREGLLGAILTGLMIWLFLRDGRSSLIVMTTIPLALLAAVVALWASNQTINIMTLGGLALAVGILVDEGVVEIENIDRTLQQQGDVPLARSVLHATQKTVVPRFLSMLAIVAVFIPSFFMSGVAKALFVPLSLAVAFSMVASFLLSSSLLPVMFLWTHRGRSPESAAEQPQRRSAFEQFQDKWRAVLERLARIRWMLVAGYLVIAALIIIALGPRVGKELFPRVAAHQFRLRFDAPVGTRPEETAQLVGRVLKEIGKAAGTGNVLLTLGYVGTQGSAYPINTVFLWTSGPHEAVISIALRPGAHLDVSGFEEKLRRILGAEFPGCSFSFEPGDLVSQIMNFGSPTPVEVAMTGPDFATLRAYSEKLRDRIAAIPELRDLRFEQPLDYPSVNVQIDRELAGQLGVDTAQVAKALSEATYSSRFTTTIYWADPKTGVGYQVQVQYPQPRMTSLADIKNIPVMTTDAEHPLLADVARVTEGVAVGEYDRRNGLWLLTLSANAATKDLGRIAAAISSAIRENGPAPRGVTAQMRGQIAAMQATFSNLRVGILLAAGVIFLLLAANFQSFRLSWVVFTTVPATICGVIIILLLTHTTLNVESYMGAIMALGVGTANALLLVTFAEERRRSGARALEAAIDAARVRMRPILMTSAAMIAGMIPMALALGTGAEETSPLGRAVIGGLAAATVANLTILPFVFAMVQAGASTASPSLDPDAPNALNVTT